MSLASVTVAFIAALARPRADSRLELENARLRADNARLRQIANALQAQLAEAQSRYVHVQHVPSPFEGMLPDERRREATWMLERQALRDYYGRAAGASAAGGADRPAGAAADGAGDGRSAILRPWHAGSARPAEFGDRRGILAKLLPVARRHSDGPMTGRRAAEIGGPARRAEQGQDRQSDLCRRLDRTRPIAANPKTAERRLLGATTSPFDYSQQIVKAPRSLS